MKKNILSFLLLAALFSFSACNDFLDTESPSEQTPQTTFENEGMTRSAIMGIYAQMCNTYVYGQKMSVNWQGVSDIEMASGYADDNSLKSATGDTPAANYWDNANNNTTVWSHIFKMAELASTAVEGIRNSDLLQDSPSKMQPYLGEALVLRSLAYFELTRRWGDIPFRSETSNSDLSNVYMGKISRDSIYQCLIDDMQEAIEYLPYMGKVSDYNCERVTKGFAKGLLARIALFAGGWSIRDQNQFPDVSKVEKYSGNLPGMEEMGGFYVGRPKNWQDYYAIAEKQCAELLSDPENPHQLDPDYGNIWKTVCSLGYNSYNENMFEVANGVGQNGDIGTLMGYPMDGEIGYGSRGFGGSYVSTNGYYFYSFTPTDGRRDYAATWQRYGKNSSNNNVVQEYLETNMMSLKFGKWNFFWTNDAYKSIALTATARTPTGINWILMRYSDIYLMFAEARYMLENNTESRNTIANMSAREALYEVRGRAFANDPGEIQNIDPDFFEAIVHERAWEFGCEGIRKMDLVRWGLLDKKIEDMKEALVLMFDGSNDVKIFDKTYTAGQFPTKIYYKYQNGNEFIDMESVNFYGDLPGNPNEALYAEKDWFPKTYWDENRYEDDAEFTKGGGVGENYCKILIAGSGLRASYDYTTLFAKLKYGDKVKNKYDQYKVGSGGGNGVCNYRHLYSIYYEDISKSKGYLSNSYGY